MSKENSKDHELYPMLNLHVDHNTMLIHDYLWHFVVPPPNDNILHLVRAKFAHKTIFE